MKVLFQCDEITSQSQGEIDDVLQRLVSVTDKKRWSDQQEEIQILSLIDGGRSSSQVFEALIKTPDREFLAVIKKGPLHNLKGEYAAFDKYLRQSSRLFVPIVAVTPALIGESPARIDEHEAVVYDHAAHFAGAVIGSTRTFEELALEAVQNGGPALQVALDALGNLFTGIQSDLYGRARPIPKADTLHLAWNRRLGEDAVVIVDRVNTTSTTLETSGSPLPGAASSALRARDIADAALRCDASARPGDAVQFDARMAWWGKRLMAEVDSHHLRIEIVADNDSTRQQIAGAVTEGSKWAVRGRLVSLRGQKHRDALLRNIAEWEIADGRLTGPGARVPNPFANLAAVMEESRSHRIVSLVHGDLNPRNILVVRDRTSQTHPLLIDYAFTREGEPIYFDFTRLEGCLVRDILPAEISWKQHVRLQRLLAWACRLGDEAAEGFAQRLEVENHALCSAFRLLWTIRQFARDAYPANARDPWYRDYLEQLYLFAHLTCKWPEQPTAARYATAAMAGVAAEMLASDSIFQNWEDSDLHGDGAALLPFLRLTPLAFLPELASMAQRLRTLPVRKDDPLREEFEATRTEFVRQTYRNDALAILENLKDDHDVFINLKAYIDLQGEVKGGLRRRRKPSAESREALDEIALAESEELRTEASDGDDVLTLLEANPAVVLIGDAGAGKSTVVREWEYRLAQTITESGSSTGANTIVHKREPALGPWMPVVKRASGLVKRLAHWKEENAESCAMVLDLSPHLLTLGAIYLIVDALNETADQEKQVIAAWIAALHNQFPDLRMVVCHRQYNYNASLLPFPVVLLHKVKTEQAKNYIRDYLREKQTDNHAVLAERLIHLLLDNPDYEQVRDLTQTPLFLWMIVDRYRETQKLPENRGQLFRDFSQWYMEERHHREHGDVLRTQFSYDEKALMLGALGFELVQQRQTSLAEKQVSSLVPQPLQGQWKALLDEIVASEMLQREQNNLRFLHQSFQEYFAARHFLEQEAKDPASIRARVYQHGWHDTMALLMGFGGDQPEVIEVAIEAALQVNPTLTARCLRMAEAPDSRLLEQFVCTQEEILWNPQAGATAHTRAASALAEYGGEPARLALWKVASSPQAPEESRVEALGCLANMPGQPRFERVSDVLRRELLEKLPGILDEQVPTAVQQAAIDAVVKIRLIELSAYLSEVVQQGLWPLCHSAWKACVELKVPLTSRQKAEFAAICEERLSQTEEELFQETVIERIDTLNEERVAILRQLASPVNLPLLLRRRFSYGIQNKVAELVEEVLRVGGEPLPEGEEAWTMLIEEVSEDFPPVDKWLDLLRNGEELTAIAAAHRLIELGKQLPAAKLNGLFEPTLSMTRLSALAYLVEASDDRSLVDPLETLIRSLIKVIDEREACEAFSNLISVLKKLDRHRGNQITMIASMGFTTIRWKVTSPGYFPLMFERNMASAQEDYLVLLGADEESARAAVLKLSSLGQGQVLSAMKTSHHVKLGKAELQQLYDLAQSTDDAKWQQRFAGAAVEVQTVAMLPWLLLISANLGTDEAKQKFYSNRFGTFEERYLAMVLRSIGYLVRVAVDEKHVDEGKQGLRFLRQRYATLAPDEDRSVVVGLTTGLGYVGDWEPILTHLGAEEPWMHEAAINVCKHWVPTPLDSSPDDVQRERVARWIVHRLHDRQDLPPQVRSSLERIKDDLEGRLGRHIGREP